MGYNSANISAFSTSLLLYFTKGSGKKVDACHTVLFTFWNS